MKRTQQERIRLGLLFFAVCFLFAVVTARLVHLQVLLGSQYSEIVEKQSSGKVPIPASRGIIYDRNGKVVANNVVLSSLYAYPRDASELKRVSSYIEKTFNLPSGTAKKTYGLGEKRFRWIRRKLDDALADRIASEAPTGLYLREETQRDYPFGNIGKQILGFTDIDGCGKSGIELEYDSVLSGREGWADIRRDGLRNTFRVQETALVKPVPGQSIVLTVDWSLQEILEEELRQGVTKCGAKSGMGVFIDCSNGQVLGAAHYDPAETNPDRPVKLRAIADQFEPGSILKALTVVGPLEDGLVNFQDSIYCEEGKWKLGRKTLHDDKEHGWLSFREVVELSSNIGIAKCAIQHGGEELFQTLRSFGLGRKTGIELPGETSGRLAAPSRWSDYNIAALAMGHSITVSSLQMATSFAAIANGGILYRPQLILGEVDEKGNLCDRRTPDIIGRPLGKTVADTLAAILRGVVENGTAESIKSGLISIAGKTGTAQIPDPANHRYFWNRYMGSFAGFFPCERPMIAGIVVMEDPQPIHYGGLTAGPVFLKIAERYGALHPNVFTISKQVLAETSSKFENTLEVPDLVGRKLTQAKTMAEKRGLILRCGQDDGTVVWQFPPADRLAFKGDEVIVMVSSGAAPEIKMTDLTGLSIKRVSAFLSLAGIKYTVVGNGRVVRQSVKPGESITDQTVCRLECQPI